VCGGAERGRRADNAVPGCGAAFFADIFRATPVFSLLFAEIRLK